MAQVKDITALSENLMAVTIEDENGRDVRLFQDRASERQLEDFKVWVPRPDAVTRTVQIEYKLAMKLIRWCAERGLTMEHILRAIVVHIAMNRREEWIRSGEITIPWDSDYDIAFAAMRRSSRATKENGTADMSPDEINAETAAARAERDKREKEEAAQHDEKQP